MEKQRIFYFDILRILATFAVVVLHVAAQNWYSQDVHSFAWNAFNIYDSLVRFAVPVFCMVSGALFLDRNIAVKSIYTKYLPRIVGAFLFSSSIYAFWDFFRHDNSLRGTISQVFQGHYHLWFLLMIAGLYVAIPVLKKIAEDKTIEKYFLLCAFSISFIVPLALSLFGKIFGGLAGILRGDFNTFNPQVFSSYSFYFVLGHFLKNADFGEKPCAIWGYIGGGIYDCGFRYFVANKKHSQ